MTRELDFRTTFRAQLAFNTSWNDITEQDKARVPLSDYPCFSVRLGETRFTEFDMMGRATKGEEDFVLTLYFHIPVHDLNHAHTQRSNYLVTLELFANGGYVTPPVTLGATYRIDGTTLLKIEPPSGDKDETRHAIVVKGKYWFVLF
jgi:hypothetical protein